MTDDLIPEAVKALRTRIFAFPDGVAKFVLPGHGTILIGPMGVNEGDGPADVTLTASEDVFRGILEGRVSPMAAYMTGKLNVEGTLALAFKLAGQLA